MIYVPHEGTAHEVAVSQQAAALVLTCGGMRLPLQLGLGRALGLASLLASFAVTALWLARELA